MAMPAPLAAPKTPRYNELTFAPRARKSVLSVAAVAAAVAGGGGTSCPILDSDCAAPREALLPSLVCSLTLSVSRGWIVLCDAARARAPAKMSLAGFSGTLLTVKAVPLVLHVELHGEELDAAMLETITFGPLRRPPPRNRGRGTQAKGLGTYLIMPTTRGRKGIMLL
jgi:hypothetical protein